MEIRRGTPRPGSTIVYPSSRLNTFTHAVEDIDPALESPGIKVLSSLGWTFERVTYSGGAFTHYGLEYGTKVVGLYTEINTKPQDPSFLETGKQLTFTERGRIPVRNIEKRTPEALSDIDLQTYVSLSEKSRVYTMEPADPGENENALKGLLEKPQLWDWFASKIKQAAITAHLQPRILVETTPEGATLVSFSYILATGNWDSEFINRNLRKLWL